MKSITAVISPFPSNYLKGRCDRWHFQVARLTNFSMKFYFQFWRWKNICFANFRFLKNQKIIQKNIFWTKALSTCIPLNYTVKTKELICKALYFPEVTDMNRPTRFFTSSRTSRIHDPRIPLFINPLFPKHEEIGFRKRGGRVLKTLFPVRFIKFYNSIKSIRNSSFFVEIRKWVNQGVWEWGLRVLLLE